MLKSKFPFAGILVIATAANTQFAMQQITADFTADTGIETELVISSSGKHTAQILAGAPYDLFISADMRYPGKLFDKNLTTGPPKIYALGQLVLWTLDTTSILDIDHLEDVTASHIAIPNPETAPYGRAAKEALQTLGLWQTLKPQFVYGESVAQTNQYIISGATTAGFTAMSVVLAPENEIIGKWLPVADSLYSPIAQGVVILKRSSKPEQAENFYQYLLSEKSMTTLRSFGYLTVANE